MKILSIFIFFIAGLIINSCATIPDPNSQCRQSIFSSIMTDLSYVHCLENEAALKRMKTKDARCEDNPICVKEKFDDEHPITTKFNSTDYKKQFEEAICGKPSSKNSPWLKLQQSKCDEKYNETFVAKLIETYKLGNGQELSIWCKANPIECSNRATYEEKAEVIRKDNRLKAENERSIRNAEINALSNKSMNCTTTRTKLLNGTYIDQMSCN